MLASSQSTLIPPLSKRQRAALFLPPLAHTIPPHPSGRDWSRSEETPVADPTMPSPRIIPPTTKKSSPTAASPSISLPPSAAPPQPTTSPPPATSLSSQASQTSQASQASQASQTSAAPRHHNVGAIAGGSVGGFVVLALLILIAFLWLARRRRHRIAPSAAYRAAYGTTPPPICPRSVLSGHHFLPSQDNFSVSSTRNTVFDGHQSSSGILRKP